MFSMSTSVMPVTIVVFVLLGLFTPMAADDYCHAADVATYGAFGSVAHSYTAWSGRYSHLAATGVLYAVAGSRAPAIASALTVLALTLTLAYAVPRHWRTYAPVLLLAAFLLHPNLLTVLYWMPGAVTYLWPLAGALLLVGLVRRDAHPLALTLAAFAVAGFHEATALVLTLGALLLAVWRRDSRALALLTGASVGLAVVILSPGNAVRSGLLPPPMPLVDAGIEALRGALVFILERIFAAPVAVALLISFGVLAAPSTPLRRQHGWLSAIGAVGVASITAALFPSYYALHFVPERATTLAVVLLAVTLATAGYVAGHGRAQPTGVASLLALLVAVTALGWALRATPLMLAQAMEPDNPRVASAFAHAARLDTPDIEWVAACRERYLMTQ